MISLKNVPLSRDKLVDWVFKQFVSYLRKETLHIKRKRGLLNPDDKHRKTIRGLMEPGNNNTDGMYTTKCPIEITINSAKNVHGSRDEEVKTLIHELSHIVFWFSSEKSVRQLERILVKKFTKEQKDFLKTFIPRHEVKPAG